MNYLGRLKESFPDTSPVGTAKTAKSPDGLKICHQEVLPKLPKAPFDSFDSRVGLRFSENADRQPPEPCPTCGRLQDIPEVPRSGAPQPVEAWTLSGNRLVVPAYSEEHAAAIRRMNPPPTGDKQETFLLTLEVSNNETKIDAADRQEAYEERAAIMEYDGGLTMREAEHKAGTCYYCRRWRGTRSDKGDCCIGLAPPVARQATETCEQFTMYRPPSQRDYAPDDDDRYLF